MVTLENEDEGTDGRREPPSVTGPQLEAILAALEVSFVKLAECLVAPGWRLSLSRTDAVGLHYNVRGRGVLVSDRWEPIKLQPHTLVILPKNATFRLESEGAAPLRTKQGRVLNAPAAEIHRFEAGSGDPEIIMICGYFRALYGASIDLFEPLQRPIVEQFREEDQLDCKLKEAIAELVSQEIGGGVMAAGLLKLVLIMLLRRSHASQQLWAERFGLLRDVQIARAFSEMAARPAAPHTVHSLANVARLSRSSFMARFSEVFGHSPMAMLKQLRLRHAVALLTTKVLSIDQIARTAGYANRSTFSKAFRAFYGIHPSEYRRRFEIEEGDAVASHTDLPRRLETKLTQDTP